MLGGPRAGIQRKTAFKDATPTKRARKSVELFPPPTPLSGATDVWIS